MAYQWVGISMSANQQLMLAGTGITLGSQETLLSAAGNWVCPAGVFTVSAVLIGRGGSTDASVSGGGGGALVYVNNFSVTPGSSYAYTINTTSSSLFGAIAGSPGVGPSPGIPSGTYTAGFYGGSGGSFNGGGGGAGGYSGDGGIGGSNNGSGASGSGGGSGGGGSSVVAGQYSGKGGGTGVLGAGASGAGGLGGASTGSFGLNGDEGSGGSGGNSFDYGGGGAFNNTGGAVGAIRIIWPGSVRQFPSTRTANE